MTIKSVKSGALNGLQLAGVSSVARPSHPPSAPTVSDVLVGQAIVTFTPDTKGPSATSFTVTATPGDITATGASSPITLPGLTASTTYTVKVFATNANGNSQEGPASASFTTLTPYNLSVDYLVIGGGQCGAGGYRTSAGTSGANSSAESAITITSNQDYAVTVGAAGSNSVFSTVTSTRGGAADQTGGSGGGRSSGTGAGFAGTANQGMAGGGRNTNGQGTAGGGGAGQVGATGAQAGYGSPRGGAGGNGLASTITGTSVTRAGGGGGNGSSQASEGANPGAGGSGGGGAGSSSNFQYIHHHGGGVSAVAGSANTGSGGGGGGGSGVVILRYDSAKSISLGAGLTGSTSVSGGNKVTTITAGTGNVSWV
jgi:hypothetical protein